MNRKPPRGRFVPRLESLEDRTTPTCTITQQDDLLVITGSAGRDLVRIGEDGLGNVNVLCDQEQIARRFSGVTRIQVRTLGGADRVRYDLFNNVPGGRLLDVDLGAGADRFDGFLNDQDVLGRGALNLFVHGREGPDVIRCDTTRDPEPAVAAVLAAGLNTSTFGSFTFGAGSLGPLTLTTGSPGPGTDIAADASLTYRFRGEDGADSIVCNHVGTLQGVLLADLDGGVGFGDLADEIRMNYVGRVQATNLLGVGVGLTNRTVVPGVFVRGLGLVPDTTIQPGTLVIIASGNLGNDRIVVDVALLPGSTGAVRARVLGEFGNDNLTLNIRPPAPVPVTPGGVGIVNPLQTPPPTIDGQIIGGPGVDGCTSLGNVARFSCP